MAGSRQGTVTAVEPVTVSIDDGSVLLAAPTVPEAGVPAAPRHTRVFRSLRT